MLQIFPRHPAMIGIYYVNGSWTPHCIVALEKRFSDAELCAEYWAACFDYMDIYGGHHPEVETLRRFANHEHSTFG